MKAFKVLSIILNVAVISFSLTAFYFWGYLRDNNYELTKEQEIVEKWIDISLIISLCSVIFMIVVVIISEINEKRGKIFIQVAFFASILTFGLSITVFCVSQKESSRYVTYAENNGDFDYIESEYLDGQTLDSIMELIKKGMDDDILPVYIGREDCVACKNFEQDLIKVLEENDTMLPSYYTNIDRDTNKEKLENFLGEYNITSVPFMMIIGESGQVIERWYEPEEHLEDLENYLKDSGHDDVDIGQDINALLGNRENLCDNCMP